MKTIVSIIWQGFVRQYALVVGIYCLCLLPVQVAQAGIKTCKLADGSVVFQDTACAVIVKIDKKTSASNSKSIPFGIDKTWFDSPPSAPDEAFCTKAGCECAETTRKFKSGLPLAIADALYLDGSWHRLEATLTEMELSTQDSNKYAELSFARDEAACNILMSQKTLRMFGKTALAELRAKKRYAEDMGLDNTDYCNAGDTEVCKHIDTITLYHRIVSDIKALGNNMRISNNSIKPSDLTQIDKLAAGIADEVQAEHSTQPELQAAHGLGADLTFGLEKIMPTTSATFGLSHMPRFVNLPFNF